LGLSIEDLLDDEDGSSNSNSSDDEEADESSSSEDGNSNGSDGDDDDDAKEKKSKSLMFNLIKNANANGNINKKKRPLSDVAATASSVAEVATEDEPVPKKRRILPWEKTAAITNTYIFAFMWENVGPPFFVLQFRGKQEDENAFVECVRLILRAHLSPRKFYMVIRLWFGVGSLKETLNTCRSGAGDIFDAYQELQKVSAPATTIFSRCSSPPMGEKIQYLCYFGDDDDDEGDED